MAFLDDEDEDMPGTPFNLTQPYITGRAFGGATLDLLTIASFYNPMVIKVINTIIFGGASLELERILAEGTGLIGGDNISASKVCSNQAAVVHIPIEGSALSIHAVNYESYETELYNASREFERKILQTEFKLERFCLDAVALLSYANLTV